jgi:Regulator of ribonuclease activity B
MPRQFLRKGVRTVERIDDAAEADERVLDHLVRLGCDPAEPRETRHYLYFAAPARAENVASTLRADGWSASIEESEGAWLLVARHVAAVTSAAVRETRVRLVQLASEQGGFYDGWEAPV